MYTPLYLGNFTINFTGCDGSKDTDGQFDGPNAGLPKIIGTYAGSSTYRIHLAGSTAHDSPFPNECQVGDRIRVCGRS